MPQRPSGPRPQPGSLDRPSRPATTRGPRERSHLRNEHNLDDLFRESMPFGSEVSTNRPRHPRRQGIGGAGNVVGSDGRHMSTRAARREIRLEEEAARLDVNMHVSPEEMRAFPEYDKLTEGEVYRKIIRSRLRERLLAELARLRGKEAERGKPTITNVVRDFFDALFPTNYSAKERLKRQRSIRNLSNRLDREIQTR